ncbi:MAG: PH domain-containing protein [Planctomycetota bacterium]|nr:PH domain-containing protein [Planctomycetota bacterium]
MSGWYYRKIGLLDESTEGPISDAELLQLAHDGKLKLETLVCHESRTKGQWVKTGQIPAAKVQIEKGAAERQIANDEAVEAKRKEKQQKRLASEERKSAEAERRATIVQQAAEQKARSPVTQFLLDGQSEAVVTKVYTRVCEILTSAESIEYIAVQAKPIQIAPDCVVCTNRRLIIFCQKMLGQMVFHDYRWLDLHDAHISEGIMYAEISVVSLQGSKISIGYLPKSQARRIYRIAQEREEEMIELRRQRSMEESRAGASNVVVTAPAPQQVMPMNAEQPKTQDDPVAKLTKLKQMLDAGLIEQEEYAAAKAKVLSEM